MAYGAFSPNRLIADQSQQVYEICINSFFFFLDEYVSIC